jgi:AbrB family looped-hinge helix DNA binding protein
MRHPTEQINHNSVAASVNAVDLRRNSSFSHHNRKSAMKATVDESGRIELPATLRDQLGLHPGDDVILEEQAGQWILRPARETVGLQWEGNVLVHRGTGETSILECIEALRDERLTRSHEATCPTIDQATAHEH